MITGLRITVQGSPEQVQRLSDTIEQAYPGALIWADVADMLGDDLISVEAWGRDRATEGSRQAA